MEIFCLSVHLVFGIWVRRYLRLKGWKKWIFAADTDGAQANNVCLGRSAHKKTSRVILFGFVYLSISSNPKLPKHSIQFNKSIGNATSATFDGIFWFGRGTCTTAFAFYSTNMEKGCLHLRLMWVPFHFVHEFGCTNESLSTEFSANNWIETKTLDDGLEFEPPKMHIPTQNCT